MMIVIQICGVPKMRYDADHKQKTHKKVVMEAAKAIRQKGPDKIGVAAIMAKAGLTHGGFYAHFKSKDDLVAEAIDYMFEDRMALLRKALSATDPAKGLHDYIDLYLSPLHRDRRDRGCPVVALSGDVARMAQQAQRRFEAGVQAMTGALADLLRKLGHQQAEGLATSIFFEMVGALAVARAIADSAQSLAILEQARASVKQRLGLLH
ncbi:MAG: TetR/AcrR family transcriptional regulator [Burkholderiales bacterium]|nr:TetR/AcrR family transcriptional regulator [Burkholderiales bacterium]